MDLSEAKKIVEAYQVSIAKGTVGGTVLRKISWLPFSKARIKYAYFVLIESMVKKDGNLTGGQREELVSNYTKLNTFVDDKLAEKYGDNYKLWQAKKLDPNKTKKDENLIKQYIAYTHFLQSGGFFDEVNDFVEEVSNDQE